MNFFLAFFGAHANLITSQQGHQPAVESVGRRHGTRTHTHACESYNYALTVGDTCSDLTNRKVHNVSCIVRPIGLLPG